MYTASDLRKGLKIQIDGEPYIVTEFDFSKPDVIFHLRLGQSLMATVLHTLAQMLLTAPYAIGFTFILIFVYRRISGQQQRPPWTRVLRIFFAVGICFAFFFALYEYGGGDPYAIDTTAGDFWRDVFQKMRLH